MSRPEPAPAPQADWGRALARLEGAYAPRSLRMCARELARFQAFCDERGVIAFPAAPETVAAHIERYFDTCAPSTVQSRLWYLSWAHRALDLADPTEDAEVRLAFRRGARAVNARRGCAYARQALPLNAALRDRLLAACPDTVIGWRDRALLTLGYDTLCRQSELAELRIEDIVPLPEGGARILVRASKTDPFRKGDYVYLSPQGLATVRTWLGRARIFQGPILRGVYFKKNCGRRPVHTRMVVERLRVLARAAGLPGPMVRGLTGHSMRVGAAQDLAVAGRSLAHIMRAGRWRSLAAAARYISAAPINVWAAPEDPEAATPKAKARA